MLAVWYPIELLRGIAGPVDVYFLILVAVLFLWGISRIGRGSRRG